MKEDRKPDPNSKRSFKKLHGGGSFKKKEKVEIKFDPAARREYLTGFKKRKDERRKEARKQIKVEERKIKLENRAEKRAYRESINE